MIPNKKPESFFLSMETSKQMADHVQKERKTVYLDSLDGFEFEKLCAEIFKQLGAQNIEDVRSTADEGRDIILDLPTSAGPVRTVIECKHQLKKTIGRPVVQKLHSAVVTDGRAKKGIVITTGYFSRRAIEYAKKVRDIEIELIDLDGLRLLGEKAGYDILLNTSEVPPRSFCISDPSNILTNLDIKILSKIHSYPRKLRDVVPSVDYKLELIPAYFAEFSIHVRFVSPSGIDVGYEVHEDYVPFFLNGVSGEPIQANVTDFFRNQRPTLTVEKIKGLPYKIDKKPFNVGEREAKRRIIENIIQMYAKEVSYTARNNRTYTVFCVPSPKHIFISDLKRVYLPHWRFVFRSRRHRYIVELMEQEGGTTLLILSNGFDFCSICYKKITSPKNHGICDECGGVMHFNHFWKPHGFKCSNCKRLICLNDTFFKRRLIFFKRPLCWSCYWQRSLRKAERGQVRTAGE